MHIICIYICIYIYIHTFSIHAVSIRCQYKVTTCLRIPSAGHLGICLRGPAFPSKLLNSHKVTAMINLACLKLLGYRVSQKKTGDTFKT